MLTIRLQRVGRRNDPSFRVVLTDSRRAPRSGGFLEILGAYDARKGDPRLNLEKIQYWISKGATVSGTVHNILVKTKAIKGPKRPVSPRTKLKAAEVSATAAPAEAK